MIYQEHKSIHEMAGDTQRFIPIVHCHDRESIIKNAEEHIAATAKSKPIIIYSHFDLDLRKIQAD